MELSDQRIIQNVAKQNATRTHAIHNIPPSRLENIQLREALENAQILIKALESSLQRLRKENRRYWDVFQVRVMDNIHSNHKAIKYYDNVVYIDDFRI